MQALKCAVGLAAIEVIPIMLLADTLLARWRGWRVGSRFDKLALLLIALVGIGSLLILLFRPGRRFYERRRAHLWLLVVAVASSVLAGELISRVMRPEPEQAPFHGHAPRLVRVLHPQQAIIPGVGREAVFSTNSLGIRGPEIPADPSVVKILCLGGSTTECLYLDDGKTWSHQLMLMLNQSVSGTRVWVGDMGFAGYSSTMHLRFVESSDVMHKIDLLVILVGFNDLNKALIRHMTREEVLDNEVRGPAWCGSRFLELTRLRPRTDEWRIITEQQDSGGTFMVRMREHRRDGPLRDHAPDLAAALLEFEGRLRSMVRGCRTKGVRPVLLTQPVLWSDHLSERATALLWHGWTHDGGFWPVKTLVEAMERFNDALVKACWEMRADCIDLRSMSGNEAFFYDDCHFTEAGGTRSRAWLPLIFISRTNDPNMPADRLWTMVIGRIFSSVTPPHSNGSAGLPLIGAQPMKSRAKDALAALTCVVAGVLISALPHFIAWNMTGRPDYVASLLDERYYLAIGGQAYFNHPWFLTDPCQTVESRVAHRPLPLLPGILAAKLLALGPLGVGLMWRILAGATVGLGWYLLFRLKVSRPLVAASLSLILLGDTGLTQGTPLIRLFKRAVTTASLPSDSLFYEVHWIHLGWRSITPATTMVYLIALIWAVLRAREAPSRSRIAVAGLTFGLLFHVYFYYWTAAGLALILRWRSTPATAAFTSMSAGSAD